ncbi:MAG TPA: hypothetical protein VFP34_15445 [Microlunatus sp.]|nr:hypothetical protein [Microlunatus sp.]
MPHRGLETIGLAWAEIVCGKARQRSDAEVEVNAVDGGLIGQQVSAGETTRVPGETPSELIEVSYYF